MYLRFCGVYPYIIFICKIQEKVQKIIIKNYFNAKLHVI